jgi:hypothetical protein
MLCVVMLSAVMLSIVEARKARSFIVLALRYFLCLDGGVCAQSQSGRYLETNDANFFEL